MCELYHKKCGTYLASHDGPLEGGTLLLAKNITLPDGSHPQEGTRASLDCGVCEESVHFGPNDMELRDV